VIKSSYVPSITTYGLADRLKVATEPPVKPVDHIAVLMDSSGSMKSYTNEAFDSLSKQFDGIRKLQGDPSRDTFLSYYTFGTQSSVKRLRFTERYSDPIQRHEYHPDGGTPLYDALGRAITDLSPLDDSRGDKSFLVILITDGMENQSYEWSLSWRGRRVDTAVQEKQKQGNWTFVLLGPAGILNLAVSLGVPSGNVSQWNPSDRTEYARTAQQNVNATQSYVTLRAAGARSVGTFYTDLSKVSESEVRRALPEVTDQYKRWTVDKEMDIGLFVPGKTGRPFEKGRTFYQLTKTEARVQPDKEIVLQDKATKKLYGGSPSDVRHTLGLPNGGSTVRLKPGNHAGWNLFIQSKSDNRKLVRGSEVLWRK